MRRSSNEPSLHCFRDRLTWRADPSSPFHRRDVEVDGAFTDPQLSCDLRRSLAAGASTSSSRLLTSGMVMSNRARWCHRLWKNHS
jgi:hypothetical protein